MNLLFRALDDPTRRRILDLLGERDHSAGELAAAFALGKPTISHHLAILRRSGLIAARKERQTIHYRLEATVLAECLSWFLDLMKRGLQPRASTLTHENPPPSSPGIPAAPVAGAPLRGRRRVVA